jgi:periplasmic protein TonB
LLNFKKLETMSKDINLTSSDWTDIVFEGRNKEYGAYAMRQSSAKRHIYALLISTTFVAAIISLPAIIKAVIPSADRFKIDEATIISTIDPIEEIPKPEIPIEQPKPQLQAQTVKFTPPEITDEKNIKEDEKLQAQENLMEAKGIISVASHEGSLERDAVVKEVVGNNAITETDEKPFVGAEQMPQFPGGDKELMAYITKNLKYPTIPAENGIQGRVVIRFVVSKTGDVTDVQIMKGLDPACDKEAVRVVKAMPKWIPGRQNGRAVPVYYTLPVTYRLQ